MSPQLTTPAKTHPTPRALVADDAPEMRAVVAHCLELLGFETTSVSTGKEASKLLQTENFELVVTDIVMPDGDGLQLISEIRTQHPEIRILAMTGDSELLDRELCVRLASGMGAHATLKKPFTQAQFIFAMRQVVPASVV